MKLNLIYLLIFGFILLLSGCSQILPKNSTCLNINDQEQKDQCLADLAFENLDFNLCKDISNNPYPELKRDTCYINIASKKNDFSVCDNIQDQDNKKYCISTVKKDKSYCNNIQKQEMKDLCNDIIYN